MNSSVTYDEVEYRRKEAGCQARDIRATTETSEDLSTYFHKHGHKLWRSEILSFASLEDRLVSTWLRLVLERSEGMTPLSL
jgi:hypothetical protein